MRAIMNFGSRVRQLRLEKNMPQKELALYLRVSTGTVCNYENNVHFPDDAALVRLADLFDVSLDYLLCRTDNRQGVQVLNRPISADYSIGNLIDEIVSLDSQNQNLVRQYTEYLISISKKNNSSGT